MSMSWVAILLFAVAGFLGGGVYSVWTKSRGLGIVLGLATVLAAAGGVAWLMD